MGFKSLLTVVDSSTMWYTRDEQALVIGSFYSMNGFQQCVGGLIAYGIAQIHHAKLKNWQILFTVSCAKFSATMTLFMRRLAPGMCHLCLGPVCWLLAPRQSDARKMLEPRRPYSHCGACEEERNGYSEQGIQDAPSRYATRFHSS